MSLKFLFLVVCILVSSLIFFFSPRFPVDTNMSLKGFPLLLLGKKNKRDEFRADRVENHSHENAAIACSSAETGLTHPSLAEATSLGGHPFGTEAASVPQGFENSELWVIKGWVIGYQCADSSFASASRAYKPFFSLLRCWNLIHFLFFFFFFPLFGSQI